MDAGPGAADIAGAVDALITQYRAAATDSPGGLHLPEETGDVVHVIADAEHASYEAGDRGGRPDTSGTAGEACTSVEDASELPQIQRVQLRRPAGGPSQAERSVPSAPEAGLPSPHGNVRDPVLPGDVHLPHSPAEVARRGETPALHRVAVHGCPRRRMLLLL